MKILAITTITILEIVRRRVASIVGIATLLGVVAVAWGFYRINKDAYNPISAVAFESALTILVAFAFSVVLAVGASFLAAPAIAADLDSGIALAVLPRPVSRTEYVLGKWLGIALTICCYAIVAGVLGFAGVRFGGYHPPHEVKALAFLLAQSVALFTLALVLGTRLPAIAAGIVAVAVFGASWIAGITASVAQSLNASALEHAAQLAGLVFPTDGLWRGVVFELTPAAALVAESTTAAHQINPFGVTAPPTIAFLVWCALWVLAVLAIGTVSMRKRDI